MGALSDSANRSFEDADRRHCGERDVDPRSSVGRTPPRPQCRNGPSSIRRDLGCSASTRALRSSPESPVSIRARDILTKRMQAACPSNHADAPSRNILTDKKSRPNRARVGENQDARHARRINEISSSAGPTSCFARPLLRDFSGRSSLGESVRPPHRAPRTSFRADPSCRRCTVGRAGVVMEHGERPIGVWSAAKARRQSFAAWRGDSKTQEMSILVVCVGSRRNVPCRAGRKDAMTRRRCESCADK